VTSGATLLLGSEPSEIAAEFRSAALPAQPVVSLALVARFRRERRRRCSPLLRDWASRRAASATRLRGTDGASAAQGREDGRVAARDSTGDGASV